MAAIVMTTRKALAQLIAEPAIHAAVSTAAIEIKATKSTALTAARAGQKRRLSKPAQTARKARKRFAK